MKQSILSLYFVAACALSLQACEIKQHTPPEATHLAGSTPGDNIIKTMLGIDTAIAIDYIRWDLQLSTDPASTQYKLKVSYGIAMPNTRKFMNGGEQKKFSGKYRTKENAGNGTTIQLSNIEGNRSISLRKLNQNIYHLLTPQGKLIPGNGGWSYTLNSTDTTIYKAVHSQEEFLLPGDTAREIVLEGRTPCQAIAKQMNLRLGDECWKMKWGIELHRDAATLQPTVFQAKRITHLVTNATGTWSISKTNTGNILTLHFKNGHPVKELQFLIGDENVLFFLDNKHQLLAGNTDFSYTLNRIRK